MYIIDMTLYKTSEQNKNNYMQIIDIDKFSGDIGYTL